MALNKLSGLWLVSALAFVFLAVGMGYAQSKPAAQSITVFQDPT